jgi:hypothetical protein
MRLRLSSNIVSVTNNLTKKTSRIRVKLAQTPMRIARLAQANLRMQMLPNKWSGHVYNNILAHQLSETTAVVTSSIEGIYLDSMRTHAVKLTPRNLLWYWAYSKGNENVRKVADRQGWLTVRAHPFINTALQKTYQEVGTILKDSIKTD